MNAAFDGPHKCYGFNIYPNNISEYSKYIDQLDQFKVENVEEIRLYENVCNEIYNIIHN